MKQVVFLLRAQAEHLPKEITVIMGEAAADALADHAGAVSTYADFYEARSADGTRVFMERSEVIHIIIRDVPPEAPPAAANDNAPGKPSDDDWATLEAA